MVVLPPQCGFLHFAHLIWFLPSRHRHGCSALLRKGAWFYEGHSFPCLRSQVDSVRSRGGFLYTLLVGLCSTLCLSNRNNKDNTLSQWPLQRTLKVYALRHSTGRDLCCANRN